MSQVVYGVSRRFVKMSSTNLEKKTGPKVLNGALLIFSFRGRLIDFVVDESPGGGLYAYHSSSGSIILFAHICVLLLAVE